MRTNPRPSKRRPLGGTITFLREVIRDYHHTGAVWPSSQALAKAMTRSLAKSENPKRLLEVGPGTGPVTKCILKSLHPGDELHLVEVNPAFAKRLNVNVLTPFRAANPDIDIQIHCDRIERVELDGQFDFIISSLPFNNFPPAVVRAIFRRLFNWLKDDGQLVYFEYAGVRILKGPLVGRGGRKNLRQIDVHGRILRRRHDGRRELVLGNLPPAVAVTLTGDKRPQVAAAAS